MNIVKDLIDYISRLFTWWVVVMPWEQGIRVTFGKKLILMNEGVYLKLPLIHKVYVQEKRLRVMTMPMQTVTTADGHPITISLAVGYSIKDIVRLYNTLYQPDTTIQNIVSSSVASFVSSKSLVDCNPKEIETVVLANINVEYYGLEYSYIRVVNYASVRTLRLIQDSAHMWEGLDLRQTPQ
jgi:regulator of protease activity HflC (stomatin/prohibitin superfamily)